MSNAKLDLSRLLCPMPVIKIQNKIKNMQLGESLEVITTDPGTQYDIPAWCKINGHRLLKNEQLNDVYIFTIEVSEKK